MYGHNPLKEATMDRFAGKVVVITGAANGIGAAAARRFSSEGATVVLADYVEDDVMKMAATLPGTGRRPWWSMCLIRKPSRK